MFELIFLHPVYTIRVPKSVFSDTTNRVISYITINAKVSCTAVTNCFFVIKASGDKTSLIFNVKTLTIAFSSIFPF